MTYPPQPGQPYDPAQQPGQPDPYAQNQGQQVPPPQYDPYAGQQPVSGPPQPTSGVPYPPQQPVSGGPYDPQQPVSGGPYAPQQPQYDPYAQQPGTQQFQLPGQQPMYGAPPAQGGLAGLTKNKPLLFGLAGGGAVVLILIIVLIVALSGGGPKGVVEDYLQAVKDADFAAANENVCSIESSMYMDPDRIDEDAELAEFKSEVSDLDWDVLDVQEVGDSASVKVKLVSSDSELSGTVTIMLEKVDGDWKVCSSESD